MRIPASVAYSVPPATAPCVPRDARRTGRSRRCGCCPNATAASTATEIASLSFIYGIHCRGSDQLRGGGIILSSVSETEPEQPAPPRNEDEPMLYCPVCSTRLTEMKCTLICTRCGYYMSCADYY